MDHYEPLIKGKAAEIKACEFLKKHGFSLILQNYRCIYGEIDLIMQDGSHIVFVEVRYRQSNHYGNALESINKSKVRKIIKTANHFLQMKKWLYKVISRFDIIVIHPVNKSMQLDWIKNAFMVDDFV